MAGVGVAALHLLGRLQQLGIYYRYLRIGVNDKITIEMISLDITSGEFIIGELSVLPGIKLPSIKHNHAAVNMEPWGVYPPWETYRIIFPDNYVIVITFFNQVIVHFNLVPLVAEIEMESALQLLLKKLGGENKYSWGQVLLVYENRACYKFIRIFYQDMKELLAGD